MKSSIDILIGVDLDWFVHSEDVNSDDYWSTMAYYDDSFNSAFHISVAKRDVYLEDGKTFYPKGFMQVTSHVWN
jgi:hypothetical protein